MLCFVELTVKGESIDSRGNVMRLYYRSLLDEIGLGRKLGCLCKHYDLLL